MVCSIEQYTIHPSTFCWRHEWWWWGEGWHGLKLCSIVWYVYPKVSLLIFDFQILNLMLNEIFIYRHRTWTPSSSPLSPILLPSAPSTFSTFRMNDFHLLFGIKWICWHKLIIMICTVFKRCFVVMYMWWCLNMESCRFSYNNTSCIQSRLLLCSLWSFSLVSSSTNHLQLEIPYLLYDSHSPFLSLSLSHHIPFSLSLSLFLSVSLSGTWNAFNYVRFEISFHIILSPSHFNNFRFWYLLWNEQ